MENLIELLNVMIYENSKSETQFIDLETDIYLMAKKTIALIC